VKRITDPKFKYRPASSHDDASVFRRRMQARKRLAQRRARQEATAATVTPLQRKGGSNGK
jgi:hypothetical protein